MTIHMLDPTIASHAPRLEPPSKLETLDGKTIALFSNGKLNSGLVLELSAEIIRQRFSPDRFVLKQGPIDQSHATSDDLHRAERFDAALVAIGD